MGMDTGRISFCAYKRTWMVTENLFTIGGEKDTTVVASPRMENLSDILEPRLSYWLITQSHLQSNFDRFDFPLPYSWSEEH